MLTKPALIISAVAVGATAAALAYWQTGASRSDGQQMSQRKRIAILVDNGSYKAASFLSLRRMAAAIEEQVQGAIAVVPASARFAEKIPPSELDGIPAESLEPALLRLADEGYREFIILPAFIGPSGTVSEFIPMVFDKVAASWSGPAPLMLKVARVVVDLDTEPNDTRIAQILVEHVKATAAAKGLISYAVAVCDHGSPQAAVAAVRDHVAAQVATLLAGDEAIKSVAPCSMERRPEPAYDFCRPLLEDLLRDGSRPAFSAGDVIVALMFISPGKHAGAGGDIATIIEGAEAAAGGRLAAHMTPLLNEHTAFTRILAERLREVL